MLYTAGLDLGEKYIKLCIRENNKVKKIELAERPSNEDDLIFLLQEWVKNYNLKKSKVFSSISGPEINIQYFNFPALSSKDLALAVKSEATQILDTEWEEMDSDFFVLDETAKTKKVLFTACPKRITDEKVAFFKKIGLNISGLTLNSIALANSYLATTTESVPVLILNIGSKITNLAIVANKKLIFIRDISWGSEKIISELEEKTEFDHSTVIDLLEKKDVFSEPKFSGIVESVFSSLVTEVRKTKEYCEKVEKKIQIKRLIVSGGGSQIPHLSEFLSENLSLDLQVWEFLKEHNFSIAEKEKLSPFSAIAFGLSLESI